MYVIVKSAVIFSTAELATKQKEVLQAGNPAVNLMDPYNRKVMGILNDAAE